MSNGNGKLSHFHSLRWTDKKFGPETGPEASFLL